MWSHWSECSPECGTSRSRFREKESYNSVKYVQEELCPNRLDTDCPTPPLNEITLSLPFTNDELKFYSFYFLTTIFSILGLAVITYLSQLIRTPKFVSALKREKERNKLKRNIEKQKFSLWKLKQLQPSPR